APVVELVQQFANFADDAGPVFPGDFATVVKVANGVAVGFFVDDIAGVGEPPHIADGKQQGLGGGDAHLHQDQPLAKGPLGPGLAGHQLHGGGEALVVVALDHPAAPGVIDTGHGGGGVGLVAVAVGNQLVEVVAEVVLGLAKGRQLVVVDQSLAPSLEGGKSAGVQQIPVGLANHGVGDKNPLDIRQEIPFVEFAPVADIVLLGRQVEQGAILGIPVHAVQGPQLFHHLLGDQVADGVLGQGAANKRIFLNKVGEGVGRVENIGVVVPGPVGADIPYLAHFGA